MLQSLDKSAQRELGGKEGHLVEVVSATSFVAGEVGDRSLNGLDAQFHCKHLTVGVIGVLGQLVLGQLDESCAVVDQLVGVLAGGIVVVHLQGDLQLLGKAVFLGIVEKMNYEPMEKQ